MGPGDRAFEPHYSDQPPSEIVDFRGGVLIALRKPPAMPVEVSRKKALASSIERSESRITTQQIRIHPIETADAHLRAAEHLM